MEVSPGPECPRCGRTEARCARDYPCCVGCGHTFATDIDDGCKVRVFVCEVGHRTEYTFGRTKTKCPVCAEAQRRARNTRSCVDCGCEIRRKPGQAGTLPHRCQACRNWRDHISRLVAKAPPLTGSQIAQLRTLVSTTTPREH